MKQFLKGFGHFLISFLLIMAVMSALWFVWHEIKYVPLTKNMVETEDIQWHKFFVKEYTYTDSDGYQYSLEMPGYLSFYGTMHITYVSGETYKILIINTYLFGNKYLVQLGPPFRTDEINYSGHLISGHDDPYIEGHQDDIRLLLDKANAFWHLHK